MKNLIFPSSRSNGSLIQLTDFLQTIPENNFIWAILDFYGIGNAPNGLLMEDFETLVRSKSQGFIMNWAELQEFAGSLEQTYDCLIVAAKSLDFISSEKSEKENFKNCEIVIEAFDSTEWLIWARNAELMEKFSTVAPPKSANQ